MRIAFKNPWCVVLGGVTGLIVCNGPVLAFTFGVFLKPIMADMHWDRGTASFALSAGEFLAAFAVPVYGRMMDRWTIRKVALPGIVAFALCLVLMGLTPHSLVVFTILFTFTSITGSIQTPLGYTKAISAWFDRRRGLALGCALAGVGIGGFIVPQLANYLIAHVGWRGAYMILGGMVLAVAFPAVGLFVREPAPGEGERHDAHAEILPGIMPGEAVKTRVFWLLSAAFFLVAMALLGSSAHVVPLLTDRGLSPTAATATFSLFGLSTLSGRLLSGYLIDRIFASYIASVFWLAPIAGFVLLIAGSGFLPGLGVILIGVGLGTEVDLIAFMISRYLGLRAFGALYGLFFMMFALGGAVGRFLGGYLFDLAGSYNPALIGAAGALAVAVVLVNRLGPYAYPVGGPAESSLVAAPAVP
ncbi:MAG TPA: MFS transporter [Stellaceae bacterium]|nr:MFS transporter [Stellaceae bacterium]